MCFSLTQFDLSCAEGLKPLKNLSCEVLVFLLLHQTTFGISLASGRDYALNVHWLIRVFHFSIFGFVCGHFCIFIKVSVYQAIYTEYSCFPPFCHSRRYSWKWSSDSGIEFWLCYFCNSGVVDGWHLLDDAWYYMWWYIYDNFDSFWTKMDTLWSL
jgi:hypothetical protein